MCDASTADLSALREPLRTLWRRDDRDGSAAVFERNLPVSEGAPLPPGPVAIAGREAAPTGQLAPAVLCADRLDRRPDAPEHARRFLNQGGVAPALDARLETLAKL